MPLMALAINRYGEQLHERFKLAQAAFSSLNDRAPRKRMTSIRMIKAFGLEDRQSALFAADAARYRREKTCAWRILMPVSIRQFILRLAWRTCWQWAAAAGWWCKAMTLGQLTSFAMYLGLMIWPDAGAGLDVYYR